MTHTSPATNLPLEIIEVIVVHLIHDIYSLRACCLTRYSWYIAAVPHLHNSLITHTGPGDRKFRWPNPLHRMHTLGLLPFVKILWIRGGDCDELGFSPKRFNCRVLRQSFESTNVQRLMIEHLDIPNFMPRMQGFFGHFLPTVRELALKKPKGTCRQITHFIGLFRHLDDLELHGWVDLRGELADGPIVIPLFPPPLRGRLAMSHLRGVDLLEDMIVLFRGIRFRRMDLFDVDGTGLLLDACAETLEELCLYLTDPHGERLLWKIYGFRPTIPQRGRPFRTLIYHKTSRSEHSRSRCRLLMLR